ncbi:hypothetical protein AB0J72_38065 [Dactylosporangium sp. NPDC049742]|uniref:hypothetical protein n=1 Tax=Dactylosporangium sp. NPDC049742 TaxID=3154737 RepID=UPI00344372E5
MTPETPETPGANALTAAWARTVTAGTVLSGAGVHPLLHLLATAASGSGAGGSRPACT